MENNTVTEKKDLKSERVQEEMMAAGGVGAKNPLVISLKAERVQEPEAAAVASSAGVQEAGWVELAVNPYHRVTINLPVLQVNITLEQPVAGADWNAGLEPAG